MSGRRRVLWASLAPAVLLSVAVPCRGEDAAPKVREERPRILLRAKAWEGPSAEKIREWMKLPEYQSRLKDLTGSCPAGTSWKREVVFLGYKYLLVLDRVKAGPEIKHRWLLHAINEFKVDGNLATTDNEPGRLFCKTLLPEKALPGLKIEKQPWTRGGTPCAGFWRQRW